MRAQTIRAILLAKATRTSIGALRATNLPGLPVAGGPLDDGTGSNDQQAAQGPLAHLRGGAELLFATSGVL
jgi:hypothetical protein